MILLYIFLVVLIGAWARSYNRSFIMWALIALIISPIIAAIILLCLGECKEDK